MSSPVLDPQHTLRTGSAVVEPCMLQDSPRQRGTSTRIGAAFIVAVVLASAASAPSAGPLIAFNDNEPANFAAGSINDDVFNWAVSWTQARATTNVSLSALLTRTVPAATVNWFVTTAIGPGTTAADIVHSGTATVTPTGLIDDFDPIPRTLLGSGLDFAAGTYYLVLDGPDAGSLVTPVYWGGDVAANVSVTLDPDFTLGRYVIASEFEAPGNVAAFAPASVFTDFPAFDPRLVFELTDTPAIPIPPTLSLAVISLAAVAALRRRGASAARLAVNRVSPGSLPRAT